MPKPELPPIASAAIKHPFPQRVCIIGGTGYVGLLTGVGLAAIGHNVICADVNEHRVKMLSEGSSPIYEPILETLIKGLLQNDSISFTTDVDYGLKRSDIVFITVGTPNETSGRVNLSQTIAAAKSIAPHLKEAHKTIVLKSTAPLGTDEAISQVLKDGKTQNAKFDLAVNPEFLREGRGVEDLFAPSRVVTGASSDRTFQVLKNLYKPLLERRHPLSQHYAPGNNQSIPYIETTPETAQIIKYASNAFLSVRISFANEIAALCHAADIDFSSVVSALSLDPRIGTGYMNPGAGFGGPCLKKDLTALIDMLEFYRVNPVLLGGALVRNELQTKALTNKVSKVFSDVLDGLCITVYGLAFKEGTNDVRDSVGVAFASNVLSRGARVKGYDPLALEEAQKTIPNLEMCMDPVEAAMGADALVVVNRDKSFKEIDYSKVAQVMRRHEVIDVPGILDSKYMEVLGFSFHRFGGL